MKQDVYTRVTDTILAALEQGTRPWMKPWDAAHAAGPVSRPLRHNGTGRCQGNCRVSYVVLFELPSS